MKFTKRGHTDKNPNPESEQRFKYDMPKYRNAEEAIRVLGTPDANEDFLQRVS